MSWVKSIVSILSLLLTLNAFAGVEVTSLSWSKNKTQALLKISFTDKLKVTPSWDYRSNSLEVFIPEAMISADFGKNSIDGIKLKHLLNKKGLLLKAIFPKGTIFQKESTSLRIDANSIELMANYPVLGKKIEVAQKLPVKKVSAKKIVDEQSEKKITKEILNEDYLNELSASQSIVEKADASKTSTASVIKKNDFSLVGYAGKFVVFLGVVLLIFYGVVQMMKKGALGKGKLGFLNGNQLVEVLSTTYLAPKKSLLLVRAHKQVFLISSSDGGVQFLSEVEGTADILKEGEKIIAGNNFDTDLDTEDKSEENKVKVKLKENIYESKEQPKKEVVKFTDELKKKVKSLKPLQ